MQQENYCALLKFQAPLWNSLLKLPQQKAKAVEIILAEDDIDEQYFFEVAIKELPGATNLKVLSDGVRLLDYLQHHQDHQPDVIFLDIMMPHKNGIDCLKEIKRDEKLKEIPIIMYSNSLSQDYIRNSYQYGAMYFLPKGNYPDLATSISKLLAAISKTHKQATMEKFKFSLLD